MRVLTWITNTLALFGLMALAGVAAWQHFNPIVLDTHTGVTVGGCNVPEGAGRWLVIMVTRDATGRFVYHCNDALFAGSERYVHHKHK